MKIPYKVGDLIYLQQKANKNQENDTYKTRIADLTDKAISIELPISEKNGQFAFFSDGTIVEVVYPSPDGGQYLFQSTILYRKREQISMIIMTYPEPDSIRRIQRRSYLRVPCAIDVAIHPAVSNQFAPFVATTINLSGGGLLLETKNAPELELNTEVEWRLALPMQTGQILHPNGTGKIVRSIKLSENGTLRQFSVEFTDLLERDRDTIIKYCLERQLEIRKRQV